MKILTDERPTKIKTDEFLTDKVHLITILPIFDFSFIIDVFIYLYICFSTNGCRSSFVH